MAAFETVKQKVSVLAGFSHTREGSVRITPYIMDWGGRRYRVTVNGLYHIESRGHKRVHTLGFSSGSTAFRVELDAETAEWMLVEVYYGD